MLLTTLKTGAISNPVRTPYGYHIIRVDDKRPSRGKIIVAHIMKAFTSGSRRKKRPEMQKRRYNNIYKELGEGASFSQLAKKYSDHKETAETGGKLSWFGVGEIVTEFAEAAFAITDTGKYTKPVRTNYGWHIIKLLDKKPPGSFRRNQIIS